MRFNKSGGQRRAVLWLSGVLVAGSACAQVGTNAAPHVGARATLPAPLPMMTLPRGPKSPVELFRELLAMTSRERMHALTNRTPEARKAILQKLREYETLSPNERELRLKVTELRWYLYPLLRTSAINRLELLARVPESDRALVEDRLREWDKLSPAAQKALLQNEAVIRILTGVTPGSNPPAPPRLLEKKVQEWQALPDEQRQELLARFDQFFRLTTSEKEKVLRTMSEPERRQIQRTLDKFAHLPTAQRLRCMRSFQKFTELSPAERQQFLKNAERWTLMTPEERQKWRELVSVAPTLPAAADEMVKLPRPVVPPIHRHGPPLATNGG